MTTWKWNQYDSHQLFKNSALFKNITPPHFQCFCSSIEGRRWFYLICCGPARKAIGETVLAGWELFGEKCHKFLAGRLLLTNFLLSLIMNEVAEELVLVWIHEQHCGQWMGPKVVDAEAPLPLINRNGLKVVLAGKLCTLYFYFLLTPKST
jgi:hypothetical protein